MGEVIDKNDQSSKNDLALRKMELKASLQETKIREKELTKRVKAENRTEVVKAVLRTGTETVQNVTENVGAVLQDKDVDVRVAGVCKVGMKKKETEDRKYDVLDPDSEYTQEYSECTQEYSEGSPSNIFS